MQQTLTTVLPPALLILQLAALFVLVALAGALLWASRPQTLHGVQRAAAGGGALGVLSGVAAALLTLLTPATVSSAVLIVTPLVTLVLAVLVVWRAGRAAASTGVDHATAKVVEDFNRKHHLR